MANQKILSRWNKAAKRLVGRTIKRCEYTPDEEFGHLLVFELDDGTVLFPMADDEGNAPGAVHVQGAAGLKCLPTMGASGC